MAESTIEYFPISDHVTNVYWNLEEYPISDGADPNLIRDNIEGALVEIGFLGYKQFHGHGDTLHHERDEMREARIFAYQGIGIGGVKMSPDFKIPLEMISWAGSAGNDSVRFLVIAKQKPGSELLRVLECLKSRKCTLLVLVDDAAKGESLFGSVESVLECIQVFGGAKPMRKSPPFYDSDYDSDTDPYFRVAGVTPHLEETKSSCDSDDDDSSQFDTTKIEDFSEPIRPAKGDKTAVFWDVEDCPFPSLCSDPDEVYRIIEEALRERGCLGEISIWAYVDEKNDGPWSGEHLLRNKAWDSRIYFLPGGDKESRFNRMLNDILLWKLDSPIANTRPPSVMVFADQVGEDTLFYIRLKCMCLKFYDVFLVTPTPDTNKPQDPEWPRLLLDAAHFFPNYREDSNHGFRIKQPSSEPNPKKHKSEAVEGTAVGVAMTS